MSCDNGVYLLECKNQYRVKHMKSIDNLWYSYVTGVEERIVSSRVVEAFWNCPKTKDLQVALRVAFKMLKEIELCEYGMQCIHIDKTWGALVGEAKLLATQEIEIIKAREDSDETLAREFYWINL